MRQAIRATAGKLNRSEELLDDEKEQAAAMLIANPGFGNPHVVRCSWCHETRTLFRDEDDAPFKRTARGWFCERCEVHAESQEVQF